MTKIVQNVGGGKAIQDGYTGPERELTVDTDNWDLRLHDGVTPGGHPILSRDNNDQRYQAKSAELSGLTGFAPSLRGFLVRLGPADYRIRDITVNTSELTIARPDGYDDDPLIELASTITTEHTWTAEQLFTAVVEFDAGINADVSGNVTGNLLGNVVGNVQGDLTGNAAGSHTGSFTGNLNTVGYSVTFADDQIPTTAIDGLADFVFANAIPIGGIMLWYGAIEDIPTGFYLCNGLNGTPDLRDKFVMGAGGTYAPGATAGAATHSHATIVGGGAHDHAITIGGTSLTTAQLPAHQHAMVNSNGAGAYGGVGANESINMAGAGSSSGASYFLGSDGAIGASLGLSGSVGSGSTHTHSVSVNDGSHTHTVSNPVASSLPPAMALCYIMRHS